MILSTDVRGTVYTKRGKKKMVTVIVSQRGKKNPLGKVVDVIQVCGMSATAQVQDDPNNGTKIPFRTLE